MLANAAPIQRFIPPPNGIHTKGFGMPPTNRSGLNDAASGKLPPDAWASWILAITVLPSGMTQFPNRIRFFARRNAPVENRPGALHFPDRRLPQFRSAGVDFVSQPRQQPGMSAQPLHCPGQLLWRCLVTGDQHGQQLVGDMPIRDRLTVLVAGLQQEREHVAALFEGRVGPRIGDERVDDSVDAAPVLQKPPRTPPTEVMPHYRRQQ